MKSISSTLLCMLMLMVCACGNQGKDATAIHQDKDSMVIIAVNTPNGVGSFTDSKGTFLFNKQFERVNEYSEGLAKVQQNGKWGFINTQGEQVLPCVYDYAWGFSEGLSRVRHGDWENGKWGFINAQGELVVPCIYDEAEEFSEGFAPVEQNDKYGFINTQGEVIAPCVYDDADCFSEGLAKVKQNGKYSIINTEGNVIVAECERGLTSWSVVEL